MKQQFYKQLEINLNKKRKRTFCIMGQQVNVRCKVKSLLQRNRLCKNEKYLTLDPKTSDLTIIRIIKVRTGYRCKDIRRMVVSK